MFGLNVLSFQWRECQFMIIKLIYYSFEGVFLYHVKSFNRIVLVPNGGVCYFNAIVSGAAFVFNCGCPLNVTCVWVCSMLICFYVLLWTLGFIWVGSVPQVSLRQTVMIRQLCVRQLCVATISMCGNLRSAYSLWVLILLL